MTNRRFQTAVKQTCLAVPTPSRGLPFLCTIQQQSSDSSDAIGINTLAIAMKLFLPLQLIKTDRQAQKLPAAATGLDHPLCTFCDIDSRQVPDFETRLGFSLR